jgi:hypothetical protein
MKRADRAASPKRVDRSVAWWSALLLAALITVLAALFLSARLLLSLDNEQGHARSIASERPASHVEGVAGARRFELAKPID